MEASEAMVENAFYRLEPLLAGLILFALLIAAEEAGCRWRKRSLPGSESVEKGDIALILGAVLTLMSLMLGFTYMMSSDRYEARRQLVIEEANAIGTAYLRAQTLPEPQGSELQELLRQYAALRAEIAGLGSDARKRLPEFMARTKQLHDSIWSRAADAARENPGPVVTLFLQSLNEMIDINTKRVAAFRNHVPVPIYPVLFLSSAIAIWLAGFYFGANKRRARIMPLIFAVLIASVMWLIMDLDQPIRGAIKASQQSLIDLDRDLNHPN
jgi:hypothetical protein